MTNNCIIISKLSHSISVDFDDEIFWRHLLGFTHFVKPNGCILYKLLWPGVFAVVDFCLLGFRLKLLKTNGAIWFNKMCKTKQMTPKYFSIKINGNRVR